ncbi:MAG: DUF6384 family protein [Chromatiaceae bacterium]|nr:DUF6384 family protein [Chromatiaceae bacterium]
MTGPAASPSPVAGADRPPLDDVMLAMDVVDTLRRRERLVTRELDELGREEDLKQRLKRIYEQQGIDVPDHVIEQGVAALREDRFTYKPPQKGFGHRLAMLYVTRASWGKWLGGALAAAVLAAGIYYFTVVAPDRALPEKLSQSYSELTQVAKTDEARLAVQRIYETGRAALQRDDRASAKQALQKLGELSRMLEQEYVVKIVNRPGEKSGVWRVPDLNRQARNYYVIVEAVGPSGERQSVPVYNEETGKTETVKSWGIRVDEAQFEAVRRDKQDDGIIQGDRVGAKSRGHLDPEYELPNRGGMITSW